MNNLYVYDWVYDKKIFEKTLIRIYGISRENNNVCLIIEDFKPSIYIELPENIEIQQENLQRIADYLKTLGYKDSKILNIKFVMKNKLFGANIKINSKNEIEKVLTPHFHITFNSEVAIKWFCKKLLYPITIPYINKTIQLKVRENNISPILQLICKQKLNRMGWMEYDNNNENIEKETICDEEYLVSYKSLKMLNDNSSVNFNIISFDIEVFSSVITSMPTAVKKTDEIFQISLVSSKFKKLLTIGNVSKYNEEKDVEIIDCNNEIELITKFVEIIREEKPHILTGYNIFNFDIPYIIDRSKFKYLEDEIFKINFHKTILSEEVCKSWSSSALRNQVFRYFTSEGIILVDLLPIIRKDYKLSSYSLKNVSTQFIGDTKDPITHIDIHNTYKKYLKDSNDPKALKFLKIIGDYCIKDSELVMKIINKLNIIFSYIEMSKIVNVGILDLIVRGQQNKILNQVYEYCVNNNFVLETNNIYFSEDGNYEGARVLEPVPGLYKDVVSFDYCSLYPSLIMAYNLDFSTYLFDTTNIPKEYYQTFEYEEHVGCEHDPNIIRKNELMEYFIQNKKNNENLHLWEERTELMKKKPKNIICTKRNFNFLKEPKGILPTILESLIQARKKAKKEMENNEINKDSTKEEITFYNSLNARQLALKASANSIYGACLTGDTIITLKNGKTKYLIDIKKGDKLLSYDNLTKIIEEDIVVGDLQFKGEKKIIKLFFSNNNFLECTKDHKILTTEDYIEAKDCLGKEIISYHNKEETTKCIKIENNNITKIVYDIEVEKNHNFIANSIIVHNCGVGKNGYLSFLPIASTTTYLGRKNIQIAENTIRDKYMGKIIYGDSITGDSPLLLKNKLDNKVYIERIDEIDKLYDNIWEEYKIFKAHDIFSNRIEKEQFILNNFQIWSDNGWTDIKRIIKHKVNKKIYRVSTIHGIIDVTEDHSLIDKEGKKIKPKNNVELMHCKF